MRFLAGLSALPAAPPTHPSPPLLHLGQSVPDSCHFPWLGEFLLPVHLLPNLTLSLTPQPLKCPKQLKCVLHRAYLEFSWRWKVCRDPCLNYFGICSKNNSYWAHVRSLLGALQYIWPLQHICEKETVTPTLQGEVCQVPNNKKILPKIASTVKKVF